MTTIQQPGNSDTTVALLYGGISGEREISLKSGENAIKALREEGFNVVPIDTGQPDFIAKLMQAQADVAFICLHGKGGEDGTVQGLCEVARLPYTGSGILASALAMDKNRSKVFYRAAGLATPANIIVEKGRPLDQEQIVAQIGIPNVVKPVSDGSSLGVSIVHDAAGLNQALEKGFAVSDELMIEQFIAGTELTVAVLGNRETQALPPIEIVPINEFYDFESKYADGGSEHICPARVSEQATETCKQAALKAHAALGCRGVSRTDMILDSQGLPWIIETNTIPGMTGTSLLPHAADAVGIGLGELYCKLIDYAFEK
jgi:D-alanine-D-alanine ligase